MFGHLSQQQLQNFQQLLRRIATPQLHLVCRLLYDHKLQKHAAVSQVLTVGMQLKQNVLCYFHTLCTQAVDGCSPAGLTPAAIRGGVEGCAICIIVQEASTAWSAYCTNKVAASTYVPRLHDTREIYLSVTRCFNNCGTLKEVNTAP